jgi:metallo-beta-lactamase family protein
VTKTTSASSGTNLTFWGAAGTVTGSKHLLAAPGGRVLIDCGLFQGPKEWRLRNWDAPPALVGGVDRVILTHAHLDHSGLLPRLVALAGQDRRRPEWRVYGTPATIDLCRVLLPDSAHLQEEDAAYHNKKRSSKHEPALPLYTSADAYAALRLLRARDYDDPWEVVPGVQARFEDAGHLLGSALVRLTLPDGRRALFSGDLGRYTNPLLRDPTPPGEAEVVVMESTYGGRTHSPEPPDEVLAAALNEAVSTGGCLVIPAFAVGRTQDLLYALRTLMLAGRAPRLPIYVDSPMAVEATRIFLMHEEAQDPDLRSQEHQEALRWSVEGGVRYVHTREESQALNDLREPAVIIAASGMATGGRILHHLKHRLPERRNVVLLAGYQAEGTRGRLLLDGATHLKMYGEQVPVRARVRFVDGFSAHADEAELLRWLAGLQQAPQRLFLVHGEPDQVAALQAAIHERFGWSAEIARYGQTVSL